MQDVLMQQYSLVRAVRRHLFDFMDGIPLAKLHETVPGFGIGTMLETHIHAANSYLYWIGWFALEMPAFEDDIPESVIERADVAKDRELFAEVDGLVDRFFTAFPAPWTDPIERRVPWRETPLRLPPLQVISHVMTHEFHHKGQIVSMARHLGYNAPADGRLGALFP